MDKYVSKVVEIEAEQFTGVESATSIINFILENGGAARYHEAVEEYESPDGTEGYPAEEEHLSIDTPEGTMRASVGDFIIHGTINEFYPCKPDVFERKYGRKE